MTKFLAAFLIVCSICLISSNITFAGSAEDCTVSAEVEGQKFCFKDEETKKEIMSAMDLNATTAAMKAAAQSTDPNKLRPPCCIILAGCIPNCCACLCGFCPKPVPPTHPK